MSLPHEGAVLLVDKPAGPTSHDVVARARRALRTRRIGHTGTLDPFATGLLALVVGPATRLSSFLSGADKTYEAGVRLGIATDSGDLDGAVTSEHDGWRGLTRDDVERALAGLTGVILQHPPAFSAKKVGGEAAHRKARRGEQVRLEPVPVVVHELRLDAFELPDVRLTLRCSSGTYVRALARDLGEALGCGAHLSALRRTHVGPLGVEGAVPLARLEEGELPAAAVLAPAEALAAAGMPTVHVDAAATDRLVHGQAVTGPADLPAGTRRVALVDERGLVAVAEQVGGELSPRKVFRKVTGPA